MSFFVAAITRSLFEQLLRDRPLIVVQFYCALLLKFREVD